MGCWHETCMITNAPILYEDKVISLFLIDKGPKLSNGCYGYAYWSPLPYIVYGKYNDYGSIEPNSHDNHDRLVDLINVHWRDKNNNVLVNNFKSVKELFKSQTDLTVNTYGAYNTLRNVRPVMISEVAFETILKEHKFTDYVKGEDGEWEDKEFSFGDVIAVLPEFVSLALALSETEDWYIECENFYLNFVEKCPAFSAMPLRVMGTNYDSQISMGNLLRQISNIKIGLLEYFTELAKFGWLCRYIEDARITWHPMGHSGSQDYSLSSLALRSKMISEAHDRVKSKWDEDGEWCDEEDWEEDEDEASAD